MSSLLAQLGLAHDNSPSVPPPINVGEVERWGSAFAGGLLVCQGVARGKLSGLILTGLGASLLYRGFTGHCGMYQKLGWNTRSAGQTLGVPAKAGLKYEYSITVNAPRCPR
jgi:uncharacterized membrane protein